ncbi:hypothetical protein CYMTET_46480, partial [Cymbomonas tetramitiformis]
VIAQHIRNGEPVRALGVLRRPRLPVELHYKFAPDLMAVLPAETVDSWIALGGQLQPRRLIPALMRYNTASTPSASARAQQGRAEAIRYLEHCVKTLLPEDDGAQSVYNLLLMLHTQSADEGPLLTFLHKAMDMEGEPLYDVKYALRLALGARRHRSCVHLYCMLHMYEEAVALALHVDIDLAKQVAEKPDDDAVLRKKLWLRVARHVVEQDSGKGEGKTELLGSNIRKAIKFLQETDGLLKIEDILPFFPDFVLIDDFKEAICTSLEEYNRQIEELKTEMATATLSADNIRRDISALSQRYVVVDTETSCCSCQLGILQSPPSNTASSHAATGMSAFYLFPCTHAFHASCLLMDISRKVSASQRDRIAELQRNVTAATEESAQQAAGGTVGVIASAGGVTGATGGAPPTADGAEDLEQSNPAAVLEAARLKLDEAVASECPLCGDLMIRSITAPFITAEEDEARLAASWAIR